ncbi:MAG: glycosyltransferase family 2 protein, partial [Candidatus Diapherotrites archaeon CG10_big_fil_rev_8_21_14_0_10_31_34]
MISIIIPAFNSEKTIEKTIQSILAQKTKEKIE